MKFFSILFLMTAILSNTATAQQSKQGPSYSDRLAKANEFYFNKDWKNAIAHFNKILNDTSKSALLFQRLAYSNLMDNRLDDAIKNYKKCLDRNPNLILRNIVYPNVFMIYKEQQKPDEAWAFLKAAAESGFSNTYMMDTLKILDPFRKTDDFIKLSNKVKLNAYPCLTQQHREDFDFWVGEWDVYQTGTMNLVGHSLITKDPCGCSVFENWTSLVSPQTGRSINYYDATKERWEQVYVGSGGANQLYNNGVYADNQMHFNYESTFSGSPYTGNFIFYNEGPDQVRQYQDYTADGGKTFKATTDLTYKRKKGD